MILVAKTRGPLSVDRVSGPELLKSAVLNLSLQSQVHRRQHGMRVMVMMAMMEMRLHAESIRARGGSGQYFSGEIASDILRGVYWDFGWSGIAWIGATVCAYFQQKIFLTWELGTLSVGRLRGKFPI